MNKRAPDPNTELAGWILAVVGVLALQRLWATKARPWLEDAVPALQAGAPVRLGGVSLDLVDVVVFAVLTVAVLVVLVLVRSSVRARRRARAAAQPTGRP